MYAVMHMRVISADMNKNLNDENHIMQAIFCHDIYNSTFKMKLSYHLKTANFTTIVMKIQLPYD